MNLCGPVPDRLVYTWLREDLAKQDFEVTAPGGCWMVGCPAFCPGCFQRPWCEAGQELGWVEDNRAGKMIVPAIVEPFRRGETC